MAPGSWSGVSSRAGTADCCEPQRMKVMFVPHANPVRVLTRTRALATAAAGLGQEAFLWSWSEGGPGRCSQLRNEVSNLLRRVRASGDIPRELSAPIWLPRVWTRGPRLPLAQWFNRRRLEAIADSLGADGVVNASGLAVPGPRRTSGLRRGRRVRYVYDIVDLHAPHSPRAIQGRVEAFLAREVAEADEVMVVSRGLEEHVAQRYGRRPVFLPNGADVRAIQGVDPGARAEVRAVLGLGDGPVFAFVGNHGVHSGLDFLLEVWAVFVGSRPDARLLVVGPIAPGQVPGGGPGSGVVLTGAVPYADVPRYLAAADAGVLPNVQDAFRDYAFPLKLIEYGAARLPALAVPLAELRLQNLPWVRFAERESGAWVEALGELLGADWDPAWDDVVMQYEWTKLASRLIEILSDTGAGSGS